jgi:hypothetical protein
LVVVFVPWFDIVCNCRYPMLPSSDPGRFVTNTPFVLPGGITAVNVRNGVFVGVNTTPSEDAPNVSVFVQPSGAALVSALNSHWIAQLSNVVNPIASLITAFVELAGMAFVNAVPSFVVPGGWYVIPRLEYSCPDTAPAAASIIVNNVIFII